MKKAPPEAIHRFLTSLEDSTGIYGFEGLVVRLLEAATGQTFRLSCSGQQSGQDARSESGYGNRIKVEAKHYHKSKLNLRGLVGEITQATGHGSDVDLWVLAASCRVSDQHYVELEKIGREKGVEVLLLDRGIDDLSRLDVMMAAFPLVVEDWMLDAKVRFKGLGVLRNGLADLASNRAFPGAKARLLEKLNSTLFGYDDARQRTNALFLRVVSNQGRALRAFNQDVAIRSTDAKPIARAAPHRELNTWWQTTAELPKCCAILGEEGTGKTWVAVRWLTDSSEAGMLPILLPFSGVAQAISRDDTVESILPKLLAKWTERGTEGLWARRTQRWITDSASQHPLFLILADGLNEKPGVDWPSFFRTLEDSQWGGKIAVLATDRPRHWFPNCSQTKIFHEVSISGYTDSELHEALRGYGISMAEIPLDLMELVRTPRYCNLAGEHFREMKDAADFTRERLIFLDIKHRYQITRGIMNDEQFMQIIIELARKRRVSDVIEPSDVRNLLFHDPGGRIHQEILDGGLLIPRTGDLPGYIVQRDHLVYGLGLLLADEIRKSALAGGSRSDIEGSLAHWLEPHHEMDLKVRIAGSAIFHAVRDGDYPPVGRKELLRYWLGLRNWDDGVQEAFVDYVVRCPGDFVAVADEFWRSDIDRGAAKEFLGRAFTKHRDNPRVQAELVPAVARWMSFVHPAGHPIFRHDAERIEVQRREIEIRAGSALSAGGVIEVCGETLNVVDDDGLLRMSRFGLLVISAGCRLPFVGSFVGWAVASALMGYCGERDVANWVMHLTDEDIEAVLLPEAMGLLAFGGETALSAAHTLLETIGTATATKLMREYPILESPSSREWRESQESDPCKSFYRWTDEVCQKCLSREDVPVLTLIGELGERIYDPAFPVPDSFVNRCREVLCSLDPTVFRSRFDHTLEDHTFEKIQQVLASRSPHDLAAFLRAVVQTLPGRESLGRRQLSFGLPGLSLLFGRNEVDAVLRVLDNLRLDGDRWRPFKSENPEHSQQLIERYSFLAVAPLMEPGKLFEALLARPKNAMDAEEEFVWYRALQGVELGRAVKVLESATDVHTVYRALLYLAQSKPRLSESQRERLLTLAAADDWIIRGAALRFACLAEDETLGREMVDAGASFQTGQWWETFWGTHLLLAFSSHLPFADVASRLHPNVAGNLLAVRGNLAHEVRIFADALERHWQQIVNSYVPDISLPPVVANIEGDGLSRIAFKGESANGSSRFRDVSTIWTPGPPGSSCASVADAMQDAISKSAAYIARINQRAADNADALAAAWSTTAFQWYGREFCQAAFDQIFCEAPEYVERWVAPALRDGPIGIAVRIRLGSFLLHLCVTLLKYDTPAGWSLWRALCSDANSAARSVSHRMAFVAAEHPITDAERWRILDECWTDAALSSFAVWGERSGCGAWLRAAVARLISGPALWRKAKGLTLASFCDLDSDAFEKYVRTADVDGTWAAARLSWVRMNIERNALARYWYQVFLESDDRDTAWAALQVVRETADRRFHVWSPECVHNNVDDAEFRLKFLAANQRDFEKALDRQKDLKDSLFGIKIEHDQIFPFFNRWG